MNFINVRNATNNNLKNVSLSIPMNKFISFIGKSGSGKSTLAVDVIYKAYIKETDNVDVFGSAALFKQISSLNNQKGTIYKYLTGKDKIEEAHITISKYNFICKSKYLEIDDIYNIISMLGLKKIYMDVHINGLSMSTYNKIRFLKLLLNKDCDVLIVDELATGLCYKEARVIGELYKLLVMKGYTIIAIEHSLPVINQSDYIVEIGPDAGTRGGEILFSGSMSDFVNTDKWKLMVSTLNQQLSIEKAGKKKIEVTNVNFNNLKSLDIKIPLNAIVNICGCTGAGKSSILDVIYRAFDKSADAWKNKYGIDGETIGKNYIRRAYVIDQTPVGKNSMSTIATYAGIMDSIRKIYATSSLKQKKNYTVSDFSYNGKYGCSKCKGKGYFGKVIDENELFIECDKCAGNRYEDEILHIKDCGMNIGELLKTTCDSLFKTYNEHKSNVPVTKKIAFINSVGLSYVSLGQPSGTLSGGESQRLKVTKELAKKLGDRCVFILDNPTKGLHILDCNNLLSVLRSLVNKNNSVIISDNNPFMIKNADYVIVLDNGRISYSGIGNKMPVGLKKEFGIEG